MIPSPLMGEGKGEGVNWPSFAAWLQKNNPRLFSILEQGKFLKMDEKSVVLQVEAGSVYGEMLQEEDRKQQLKGAFEIFFKRPLELRLEFAKLEAASETALQEQKKQIRDAALRHESVKEAANILGAVVEEVRTELDES